jgi:site-specific DNA-methyltransferase (adenine-specific)
MNIYRNKEIVIYNDDCLNYLRNCPANHIDLVVTSPPYNCGIDYDSYNDNRPFEEYVEWSKEWIHELYRVVKDDGRIAINVLVEQGIENNSRRISPMRIFSDLIEEAGFTIMALPMWTDPHRVKFTAWGSYKSASAPYIYNPYEVVIIACKKFRKKLNKGENTISKEDFINGCSGVWNIQTDKKSLTKATFPIELPKLIIELLSFKGELVCDIFSGSGTTALASYLTGRKFVGVEISENYFEISKNRLDKEMNQLDLF